MVSINTDWTVGLFGPNRLQKVFCTNNPQMAQRTYVSYVIFVALSIYSSLIGDISTYGRKILIGKI